MSQAGLRTETNVNPTVTIDFFTDSGIAATLLNTIDIVGANGITTSGSGNTVTITGTGSGFTWNVVTSAMNPITLANANGYICKGAGSVNFILPAAAAIGDTFRIVGYGNLWSIAQNAGQSITIGNSTSTPGAFGSVTATMISDNLTLLTVTANTEFYEIGIQGNPTII